jgi:hypothetical protein
MVSQDSPDIARADDGIHITWEGPGEAPGVEALVTQAGGELVAYTDGSGKYPTGGRARIAGSGMVFVLAAGSLIFSDAVTGGLPQIAGTRESWAALQAVRLAKPSTTLKVVTDCAMVVTRIGQGRTSLRKGRRGTGLWKRFFHIQQDKHINVLVRKPKAHRTRKQAEAQGDLADFLGNDAADKAADRGAQVYHGPADEVQAELAKQNTERQMIKWTAQKAARQWVETKYADNPRNTSEEAEQKQGRPPGHRSCQWAGCGTGYDDGEAKRGPLWGCEVCGRWSRMTAAKRAKLGPCPGKQQGVHKALQQGHHMATWAILTGKWAGHTLDGCTACAATGMAHLVHLRAKCTGHPKGHRDWVAKQLQDGRHPNGQDNVALLLAPDK